MPKIYLDYAATTPVDPRVLKVTLPYFSEKFGNSMSLYSLGQEAKQVLEESREVAANLIGVKSNEIIFTSSATESNNLVLKGVAFANRNKGQHIIISSIEHPCIMESARWLEKQGFEITRLPVDKYGLVAPNDVKRAIKKETILVSIIHASNEIGTIQPIAEIGELLKTVNYKLKTNIYFHTDAVQSFGKIEIDANRMNVDLLTASSHKMYGPKGAALLFVREGTKIEPLLHGGGHETGLRSGTINIPAIVGFAEAVKICKKEIHPVKSSRGGISLHPVKLPAALFNGAGTKLFNGVKKENQRLAKLRDKLIKGVLARIPGSYLNGHPKKRLPNNANFWFEFVEGESMVIKLDLLGIAASTGSACSSAKLKPSHVLLAIGLKPHQTHGSLRLTLGRWTKESDINYVLKVLPNIVEKLRKISPFKLRK